jgi:hypothetical protein
MLWGAAMEIANKYAIYTLYSNITCLFSIYMHLKVSGSCHTLLCMSAQSTFSVQKVMIAKST